MLLKAIGLNSPQTLLHGCFRSYSVWVSDFEASGGYFSREQPERVVRLSVQLAVDFGKEKHARKSWFCRFKQTT